MLRFVWSQLAYLMLWLVESPDDWLSGYGRGLNNKYWCEAFRRNFRSLKANLLFGAINKRGIPLVSDTHFNLLKSNRNPNRIYEFSRFTEVEWNFVFVRWTNFNSVPKWGTKRVNSKWDYINQSNYNSIPIYETWPSQLVCYWMDFIRQ